MISAEQLTCPNCGGAFAAWPGQKYCSKRCRKQVENERLGYVKKRPLREGVAIPIPGDPPTGSSNDKDTPSARPARDLSDWVGCLDCGARIRVTYSPPRCNACFNRANAGR